MLQFLEAAPPARRVDPDGNELVPSYMNVRGTICLSEGDAIEKIEDVANRLREQGWDVYNWSAGTDLGYFLCTDNPILFRVRKVGAGTYQARTAVRTALVAEKWWAVGPIEDFVVWVGEGIEENIAAPADEGERRVKKTFLDFIIIYKNQMIVATAISAVIILIYFLPQIRATTDTIRLSQKED